MCRTRLGARQALAISSNQFCKAHLFSPRQNKVPRSCGKVSRTCGNTSSFSSTAKQHHAKGKAMSDSTPKKFIALYLVPASVLLDWAKTDPETKKAAEQ